MDFLCENKELAEFSIGCEGRIIVNVKWNFNLGIYIYIRLEIIDQFYLYFFFRKRSLLKKRRLRSNSYNLYQCILYFQYIRMVHVKLDFTQTKK